MKRNIRNEFQIFGSETSIDYDVLVFVDSISQSKEKSKELCHKFDNEIYNFLISNGYEDKKVNTNLGVLKNGEIVQVFKGTADEVNNSLFKTYDNFKQPFPKRVKRLVKRNDDLKVLRCIRSILQLFSRTVFRNEVKSALKSNLSNQISVLDSIDFSNDIDFNKNNLEKSDVYKNVAFQIGQTLSLIKGDELYTKSEIANAYPLLKSFLERDVSNYNFSNLETMKKTLTFAIKASYLKHIGKHNEVTYMSEKNN